MCEVTKHNFEELFPVIETCIQSATFVAIDTEFTALYLKEKARPSLFDDAKERYKKLRDLALDITIPQLGLSIFCETGRSKYDAHTFNIFLFPGGEDAWFTCQASSLDFLSKQDFDFNKFICEGVSFMNNDQEKELLLMDDDTKQYFRAPRTLTRQEEQAHLEQVNSWISSPEAAAPDAQCQFQFLLESGKHRIHHQEALSVAAHINTNIRCAWARADQDGSITVEKVSYEENMKRRLLENDNVNGHLKTNLGFTRVWRLLVDRKVPLVGHNCFTDLILMYQMFHANLPQSYDTFKEEILRLFPVIFDTKHISTSMHVSGNFKAHGICKKTALPVLYENLCLAQDRTCTVHQPSITQRSVGGDATDLPNGVSGDFRYGSKEKFLHEAGYDAYITGAVFLRLSHMLANEIYDPFTSGPLPFNCYLKVGAQYQNRMNLIQASVDYLALEGPEPKIRRPPLLYITSATPTNQLQVTQRLKHFGTLEVEELSAYRFRVACGSWMGAHRIFDHVEEEEGLKVAFYKRWQHDQSIRYSIAAGFLGATLIGALAAMQMRRS